MDFSEAFRQLRRIEEHRAEGFEKEIRKFYQEKLVELRHFMADAYARYGQGGRLDFGLLQQNMMDARLLEEVTLRMGELGVDVKKSLTTAVEDMYRLGYTGMVEAVTQSQSGVPLHRVFGGVKGVTPETLRAAVQNPISGLTLNDRLEHHRQEMLYNTKQAIGTGLAMGDSMDTMAGRIAGSLDGDYQKATRIARTEVHRVREAGHIDAALEMEKELNDAGLHSTKTWHTAKDERVRPQRMRKTAKGWKGSRGGKANHMKMEGVCLPVEEEFDLGRGVKTMAPGQSGDAGNDINCRCELAYGIEEVDAQQKMSVKGGKKAQNLNVEEELAMIPPKHLALAQKQVSGIEVVKGAASSHYNPKTKQIVISDTAQKGTVVHEVAHALERELKLYENPKFREIWMDGLQSVRMEDIIWDNKTFAEAFWRVENSKFISVYQGKIYDNIWPIYGDKTLSLEGMREYFSEGYTEFFRNPSNLRLHDRKLFEFIEGMM